MANIKDYYKVTGYSTRSLLGNNLTNGPLNKLWRAKILLDRATSVMAKSVPDLDIPNPKWKNTEVTYEQRDYQTQTDRANSIAEDRNLDSYYLKTFNNKIILFDTSTSPATKLTIQGMPSEVNCTTDSVFVAVKSMGRNNPFYMFTNSDDTISFDISWYSISNDRNDVINKCRLLESWTKADGYKATPPVIGISWGSSDMFTGDKFILVSAPYKLENFQNSYRPVTSDANGTWRGTKIVDLKLLPNSATQKLTFKRISGVNRTHEMMIPRYKLESTVGVEVPSGTTTQTSDTSNEQKTTTSNNQVKKYRRGK